MILTRPSIEKWLKETFPKYDPKKMIVTHKAEGCLIVYSEGELLKVDYLGSGINLNYLKTKIEEYFETGIWDRNNYYEIRQSQHSKYKPHSLAGKFIRFSKSQDTYEIKNLARNLELFFVSVDKTENIGYLMMSL